MGGCGPALPPHPPWVVTLPVWGPDEGLPPGQRVCDLSRDPKVGFIETETENIWIFWIYRHKQLKEKLDLKFTYPA